MKDWQGDHIADHLGNSLPVRQRGKVRVRRRLPEAIAVLEVERLELPPAPGPARGLRAEPGGQGAWNECTKL